MIKLPKKLAIVGMGYVGTPLAAQLANHFEVIGFDINSKRIKELNENFDITNQIDLKNYLKPKNLNFTNKEEDLSSCEWFIVTVPTPVNKDNIPDFGALISASKLVAKYIKKDSVIIYESTVYPGATEEICVPVLEENSSLSFNKDFFCGYSPERINPGDSEHTIRTIKKVTSGSNQETLDKVDELYSLIIDAGTHKVSSIRIAEAAKVIENTQRDINIAFINELTKIFSKMGLDTHEVLEAAETKWNFLPFKPGLVGGHCIGVDPFYLSFKAEQMGYYPEIILSGRKINDSMSYFVFSEVRELMEKKKFKLDYSSKVLILGVTFKENCGDIRNSKVFDLIRHFTDIGAEVDFHDPYADQIEVKKQFGIEGLKKLSKSKLYNAVILAVGHKEFLEMSFNLKDLLVDEGIIFDVKGVLPKDLVDGRL